MIRKTIFGMVGLVLLLLNLKEPSLPPDIPPVVKKYIDSLSALKANQTSFDLLESRFENDSVNLVDLEARYETDSASKYTSINNFDGRLENDSTSLIDLEARLVSDSSSKSTSISNLELRLEDDSTSLVDLEARVVADSSSKTGSINSLELRLENDSTSLVDLEARYVVDSTAKKVSIEAIEVDSIKIHPFTIDNPQVGEKYQLLYAFDNLYIDAITAKVDIGSCEINIYGDETLYDTSPVTGIWDQGNETITTSTTNPLNSVGSSVYFSTGRYIWIEFIGVTSTTKFEMSIKYHMD